MLSLMLVTLSYHSCSKKPRIGRDFARLPSSLAPLRVAQAMHGLNSNSGFPTRARGEQANTSSSKGGCQEGREERVREEKRGETARAQRAGQDNQDEGGVHEREREEERNLRVTTVAVTRSGDNKGATATTARGRKTDEGDDGVRRGGETATRGRQGVRVVARVVRVDVGREVRRERGRGRRKSTAGRVDADDDAAVRTTRRSSASTLQASRRRSTPRPSAPFRGGGP